MDKVQLKILGISAGNVSSSYTLILEEINGNRKLPIVIGVLEAQAIAIEIEKIEPIRPMTHDLFRSLAQSFSLRLKEVIIQRLHEGIFYASLVATDGKQVKNIDSRTSDAIALALRFNCPIYTYESILSEAGIALESLNVEEMTSKREPDPETDIDDETFDEVIKQAREKSEENLGRYSINELKKMLDDAIGEEDYVMAAKIRDAIKKKEDGE